MPRVKSGQDGEKSADKDQKSPRMTISRLSLYSRSLEDLAAKGILNISSDDLGHRVKIKPSQIRKDLAYFGEFGKRGIGYNVAYVVKQLRSILGLNHEWGVVIVGAGNLGRALVQYEGFRERGFIIRGIFDNNRKVISERIGELDILSIVELPGFIRDHGIEIGIIAVPASAAQEVADIVTKSGIKGIINFSPTAIFVPKEVVNIKVDLSTQLEMLTYYLTSRASDEILE